ncbi:MAG: hypothetical protein ACSHYB_12825 [Roseibacillus sp.]
MKILFLLLATTSAVLACFVPPAEDILLFRRDALKLDANRQELLAKDLVTLANRPTALKDPAESRATAQLLALASNLAPKSKAPLNTAKIFADLPEDYLVPVVDYTEPLENISRTVLFLLEDPDQKEHFAVAQMLLDPLATITPELGIMSARPSAEESPRWRRAVAPAASFVKQPEPLPSVEENEMNEENSLAGGSNDIPEEPEEKPFKKVADFEDSVMVPVILREAESAGGKIRPQVRALLFEGKLKEGSHNVKLPLNKYSKTLPESLSIAESNLRNNHDSEIVAGVSGKFVLGKQNYLDTNGHTLAFPMAILMEGLLSERKPLDNLVVLGKLTRNGTIEAPKLPWQFLEILLASTSDEPRRLLIAPQMTPLLISFLTQQNEDFFFDFDIFQVATLEEALELSFENTTPENTTQAITKFQEIRRVGAEKSTSVFVSNPHVLTRLTEVQEIEPRHLSATLLKMRGSGSYPQNHSTKALAAIIQSSLMPLSNIPYSSSRGLNASTLEEIHETCRANLDPLARYIAMGDREMYDSALDLANRVRTLARAKERYDNEEYSSDSFNQSLFFNTYKAIQTEFYDLATKTSKLLDQKPPKDPRLAKDD